MDLVRTKHMLLKHKSGEAVHSGIRPWRFVLIQPAVRDNSIVSENGPPLDHDRQFKMRWR